MFRKILSFTACLTLAVCSFASCGNSVKAEKNSGKPHIVCTIFPEYDWVREILGTHTADIDVTYLLTGGSDLHSFQPTIDDIAKITNCDLFIYVGGESDEWAESALRSAENKDMHIINLLDTLGSSVKEEEVKEGMQEEVEEEEHDEDEPEYDEHVWLSLANAENLCMKITDEICEIDPDNAEDYRANLNDYLIELDELDSEYREDLSVLKENTLIFADRFPFRYLTDEYGLDYYAAFVGCSAETQASFETVAFLAEKVDELGADTIFTIEGSDNAVAEAVVSVTKDKNQKIASLNSIQSVNEQQIKGGVSYISIMRDNLNVLKEALS